LYFFESNFNSEFLNATFQVQQKKQKDDMNSNNQHFVDNKLVDNKTLVQGHFLQLVNYSFHKNYENDRFFMNDTLK